MSQTDEDVEDLPIDPEPELKTVETEKPAEETGEDEKTEEGEVNDEQGEEEGQEIKEEQSESQDVKEEESELPLEEEVIDEHVEDESETELATVDAEGLGEGEGEEEEEEASEEQEPSYYDPDDFISGAKVCKGGTLPIDILEFEYPFSLYKYILFFISVLKTKVTAVSYRKIK